MNDGPSISREIAQRAFAAVTDSTSSAQMKAQASIVLHSKLVAGNNLSGAQKEQITRTISTDISMATMDPKQCSVSVELPAHFIRWTVPNTSTFSMRDLNSDGPVKAYALVQTMNLVDSIKLTDSLRPELKSFLQVLNDLPLYGDFDQLVIKGWKRSVQEHGRGPDKSYLPTRVLFLQTGMLLGKTKDELYLRFTQKLASDIQVEIDALLDSTSKKLFATSGLKDLPIEGNLRAVSVLESVVIGGKQSIGSEGLADAWMRAAGDEFLSSYARVLAKANEGQRRAMLTEVFYSSKYFQCTKPALLEPLLKWCDLAVAGKSLEDDEQTKNCIDMLVGLLSNHDRLSAECQKSIVDRLESYTFLNNTNLWLAQGIEGWGPVMRAAVLKRSFSIIAVEVESDDPLLCEALAIARQGLAHWDSVPEELRQKAIEQMHNRLDAAAREPSKHTHLQRVLSEFESFSTPGVIDVLPTKHGSETIVSTNAIVQILNILVDMEVESNAILQKMTPSVQALHERIEKLNLMDANLSKSWTKKYWRRDYRARPGDPFDRDEADRWVFHTWYMQSGSLLGKDLEMLRLRPENLYREDQERKRRFIQPGDTLAIYVPGVLPESGDPPVIQAGTSTVVVGFPVPVSKDGTIQLRWLEPIKVQDLELSQVQEELLRQYGKINTQPKTLQGTTVQFLLRANRPQELRNLTGTGLAPPTK